MRSSLLTGLPLVFADTETQGLTKPHLEGGRRAYEWSLERVDPDGRGFRLDAFVDLKDLPWDPDDPTLDRTGLNVGRFFQRHPQVNPQAPGTVIREADVAGLIAELFRPAGPGGGRSRPGKPWLMGINPTFEVETLSDLLHRHGHRLPGGEPWYHSPVCTRTYLAGALGVPAPWTTASLAVRAGLDLADYDLHTARGDVELCRALYEAALLPAWVRRARRARLALRKS